MRTDKRFRVDYAEADSRAIAGKADWYGFNKTQYDVIVVNFHSAPLIERTIGIARELAGGAARLIVVDNSPGDGAADVVRLADSDATVIANPVNRGYAAAVNQALAVADANFVLLINPDVRNVSGSYADVLDAPAPTWVAAPLVRLS